MTKRWLKKTIEEEAKNCHISELKFLESFKNCCPKDIQLQRMLRDIEKDFIEEMNKKEFLNV